MPHLSHCYRQQAGCHRPVIQQPLGRRLENPLQIETLKKYGYHIWLLSKTRTWTLTTVCILLTEANPTIAGTAKFITYYEAYSHGTEHQEAGNVDKLYHVVTVEDKVKPWNMWSYDQHNYSTVVQSCSTHIKSMHNIHVQHIGLVSHPQEATMAYVSAQYFFLIYLLVGWFMPSKWRVRWSTLATWC